MISLFDEFMKDYVVQKKTEIETQKADFVEDWKDEDEFIIRGVMSTIRGRNREIADLLGMETSHILYTDSSVSSVIDNKNCKSYRIKDANGLIYNIVSVDNVLDQGEYLRFFLNRVGGVHDDG